MEDNKPEHKIRCPYAAAFEFLGPEKREMAGGSFAEPRAGHPGFEQGWGVTEGARSLRAVGREGALVTGIEQQPPPHPCNTNHRNRKVQTGATPHLRMTVALNNAGERCVLLLKIPLSFKAAAQDHRELINKAA